MSHLQALQARMRALGWHGLVVPTSDEYLSEFAQPFARRLEWATGFHGSTGTAIVLHDRAALFLDSRYRLQGERDTAGIGVQVLDASEATRHRWLTENLRAGQRLALDTRLQSYPDVERVLAFAAEQGFDVVQLAQNPIDDLWGEQRPPPSYRPASENCD